MDVGGAEVGFRKPIAIQQLIGEEFEGRSVIERLNYVPEACERFLTCRSLIVLCTAFALTKNPRGELFRITPPANTRNKKPCRSKTGFSLAIEPHVWLSVSRYQTHCR